MAVGDRPGKSGDFHEGVVLGMSGWDLEVLGIMFDETLNAIIFRDAETSMRA